MFIPQLDQLETFNELGRHGRRVAVVGVEVEVVTAAHPTVFGRLAHRHGLVEQHRIVLGQQRPVEPTVRVTADQANANL